MLEKPWLKVYPGGVPAEIELDADATLVSMFETACRRFADRPAFHSLGTTLTYRELESRSRDFASYLQSTGLHPGERIALMLPNVLQYPIALFGALRAGLAVVNTNPLYTPRELEHQLKDSGAVCIVVLANFAHVVEQVLGRVDVRLVIISELGDMLRFPRRAVVNWAVRRLKKLVPQYRIQDAVSFRDAIDFGARYKYVPNKVSSADTAFVQYTGGTTGVAKGAVLTHRNVSANVEQLALVWSSYIRDGEEIIITPLPLYHIFCLTVNCLTFTRKGGLNVLIVNPRDLPAFIAELKHWRFTFITGVNTLYNALLNHPRFSQLDFSRLKLGIAGGMAVQRGVADRWQKVTGHWLVEGYGLTEASPVVTCNLPTGPVIGTVGVPLPSTEISIRTDNGEAPVGEPGELCVRGPQVMKGYWRNDVETAKVIDSQGWLATGDIAVLEPTGYVRIVDRKKDMIIVSGFKIFPNEVEAVIAMHPAVVEVGCVGVPDERSGQAIKAFVVTREATLTAEQLQQHCRQYLTAYKIPKHVEFRESLPKSNIGKILRRALIEETRASHEDPSALAH